MAGYVTSGGWGYRLGQMIGLATLHKEGGVTPSWIGEGGFHVRIAGQDVPVDVQHAPFFDPAGDRMRA